MMELRVLLRIGDPLMEQSPRLSLTYVMPAQAQKHVTVNETFRRLDALTQLAVLSRTINDEPAEPAEGDAYILPEDANGADWQHFTPNNVAVFQDGAWTEISSVAGLRAWIIDEGGLAAHNGTAWTNVMSNGATNIGASPQTTSTFGVNTTADDTNRFAVKSDAVLFSHDDVTPGSDDCRIHINKANIQNTGSVLFQTGFSARAEFGLIGTDQLTMKVSADGARWTDALIIDTDNGNIGLGQTPGEKLHVFGDASRACLERPSGGKIYLEAASASQYRLEAQNPNGQAIFDLSALPAETSNALFRFFRTTDTSGDVRFDVHLGDGSSASNHRLRGNDTVSQANFVCAKNGRFGIGETSPSALLHVDGGGALFGNPAGGDKGNGKINAQAVYDDNALLSCYVFDQVLDGDIDDAKWDARTPDRHIPAVHEEIEGENGAAISREIKPAHIEKRQHEPLRKFKARLDGAYDPLTLDGYAKHWREKRHLTAMPNEASFDPTEGLATGAWIQRLVETVEVQAVLIEALNQRLKIIEKARPPKRA